jgi:DNA-directed RNA polymerase subunit M/transcription elongation factor TFIIS
MEFCPKCENVLLIKKKKVKVASSKKKKAEEEQIQKFLYCPGCGYEQEFEVDAHKETYTLSVKLDHSQKDKTLVLEGPKKEITITDEEREANEDLFQDLPEMD